ncbi:MAG: putative DNA primase/helicase [Phycisphaerales bacterium]|jgi:putative DNA primase/helicase
MIQHNRSQSLIDAALKYAELGYPVFPLLPGKSKPLTTHGFKDATTDPEQIESWWTRHPNANLGIWTEGLLVVDIDGADNPWLSDQPELQFELAGAPISQTPRGGRHLIFRQPEGAGVRNSQSLIADHVDVRADGGYIVATPSRRSDGEYRWLDGDLDVPPRELPVAPGWLVAAAKAKKPRNVIQSTDGSGSIPDGDRNGSLTSLAGSMRRRGMSEAVINVALQQANIEMCVPPLEAEEVSGIARSIAKYPPASNPSSPTPFPLTDLGNAERFASTFGDRVRFCHSTGKWLAWDGCRWRDDDEGTPLRLAGELARQIGKDADGLDEDSRTKTREWARKCESRARHEAVILIAKSQRGCTVRVEDLDNDQWNLNVLNGTIDLRTGKIHPHDRDDLITKLAPVVFDPNAGCSLFDDFLARVLGGDEELIEFVVRFLGHCLTGDISEQVFPILHGAGANGKSVLLDTIAGIMGDYACEAPPLLLLESRHSEHPTEIADLRGRRLVVASETEEGAALKLQMVKRLTGDATLKGRYMRQDYFSFARTHKTVLVTNNRPQIREQSEAVWRRLRMIPFDVVIPAEERDPQLIEKLKLEWPGILAKLVRGCLAWQRDGLGEPTAVKLATSEYRSEEDITGRFIEECFETDVRPEDSSLFTPWATVNSAYENWARGEGERSSGGRWLGKELDKRGFRTTTKRIGGPPTKGRVGLRLRDSWRDTNA